MHPPIILLCARDPARDVWLRALDAIEPRSSAVMLSDEAELLTFSERENVVAVIVDRELSPSDRDPMLGKLRDAFPVARFILSVRSPSPEMLDPCRLLGIDACVPSSYTDRQRQLALDLALSGAGTFPGAATSVRAPSAAPSMPELSGTEGPNRIYGDTYGLTGREKEVSVGIARGRTNHEIALTLGVAPGVVRNHVTSILAKLRTSNRTQAATMLVRLGWVQERIGNEARQGHGVLDRVRAHVDRVRFRQGTVIFRKGEHGEHMYYIQTGSVGLDEIDAEMGPGEIFGDIGAFAPRHQRTCTARARSDVELFRLGAEHVRRAFFESPEFALYVVSAIAERVAEERGL